MCDKWNPVCEFDALEALWGEAALVGDEQVALFRLPDSRIFAVSNADPATGAYVMSRGIVGSKGERATIASPLHKDVFDLETGACYTKPALTLPTWRTRIRDGVLEIAKHPVMVAASHGTSDPAGQTCIASLVQAVRESNTGVTVVDSYVDVQSPDVAASLESIPAGSSAVVVPLLLSAGYHVHVDLAEAARSRHGVSVSGALGPDPRLVVILARRLDEAGLRPDDQVVLVAAGSSNASAVSDCHEVGRLLSAHLRREVTVSFLSAAFPRAASAVTSVRASHPASRVIVSSYLLAPGYFATLAAETSADATSAPLLEEGEPPPPELVAIVTDLYRSMLA
ncbi:nitrite reductase small subunit NirD [Subtercola vilae]|uniref:Nitrite reductase (NAD(P)H) small subunit n=1 Tax=Subtercola vilae TaxID=2056433 RepID=A0A4V4RG22_9MICO|nr:nitrite reductase (NAD(P)H) small subunit [Subtercola vilae]